MLQRFVAPDTILAASLCMDYNCFLQSFEQLSHTESLYSNKDQTYAVYNFSKAILLILILSARIRFSLFQAVQ